MEARISIGTLLGTLCLSLVLGGPPVSAEVVPKCTSAKLKREGKTAAKALKCHAKAAGKAEPVDSECIQGSLAKLKDGFTKADEDGPCHGGRGFERSLVTEVATALENLLNPPSLNADSHFDCAAAKLKAAAKLASKKLNCYAKAAKKSESVEAECLQKVDATFTGTFEGADAAGGCGTTGDALQVKLFVDQFVNGAVELLTADLVPLRCCAASATFTPNPPLPPIPVSVSGCANLVLGTCTQAAVLLQPAGGSASVGAPGAVCNGATGSCQAVRTGTSSCCEMTANDGTRICAEGPNPFLGACGAFTGQVPGLTFAATAGAVCTHNYPSQPECVP